MLPDFFSSKKQNNLSQTSKVFFNDKKPDGIDIVFQNIHYSVQIPDHEQKSILPFKQTKKKKEILKGISGIFKAGQVTAIMGASGAGKTTLLNILSCRINPDEGGKRYANNLEYSYQTFGDFANYVMQADVLMQTLTVRQTLEFAAKLKLNLPDDERKEKVKMLANEMKLEKCLDTMVGGVVLKGVSGGQKKRTSIAFELMSNPQVIFLDEPTSGLDSLTSYIICSELKKLSHRKNKTVIMTIHQPNSETFDLFDELVVLLEGRLIYHNKAQDISKYFERNFNLKCPQFMNPPDFFMSKIHHEDEQNIKRYHQYFDAYESKEKQNISAKIKQKLTNQVVLRESNVNNVAALGALTQRSLLNTMRNPLLIRAKFFQALFMALFIGGLYFNAGKRYYTQRTSWQSITGFLFDTTINAMMTALSPITLSFPLQRDVFFKEQDSKMYNVTQYYLARMLVEIPQLIIVPLVYVSIYYFMVDLANSGGQFFIHCLIFILMSFNGASLGLLLGSVILDPKSVSAVVPIFILPIILFAGFFKNRADLPGWIGWIQYISPNKYGFIGFVENEVTHRQSNVDQLDFDLTQWEAIIVLFCLGIFFRILALFFLWALRKKSQ